MRKLKFGVEIEFFGIDVNTTINGLRQSGIEVADFDGYTHKVINAWKVTTDASVSSIGTGRLSGLELVSPILYEDEGLEELEKVYEVLSDLGASVNRSCGTHVHFDVSDYTLSDMVNFLNLYYKNQTLINYLVPLSRRDNQFCRSITTNKIREINNAFDNGELIGINDISHIIGTRYTKVNLRSYIKYGTVEFRQLNGTLDFSKTEAWIVLMYQMLQYAQCNHIRAERATSSTFRNFDKFLKELDLDDTYIGMYLGTRFEHFKEVELDARTIAV